MLREMQHEVKEGHPFEDRLCIDNYQNNQYLYISSQSDLDCCFMAILSWWKTTRIQNNEDTLEQSIRVDGKL